MAMIFFEYLHDRLINLADLPRVIRCITRVITFKKYAMTWHLKKLRNVFICI